MSNRGTWYPLINLGVHWDEKGKPYYLTSDSQRDYIPPIAAAQYQSDPKLQSWAKSQGAEINYQNPDHPEVVSTGGKKGSFFKNPGTWNSETGEYDQGLNWGTIMSLVVGGMIAAPAAIELLGGTTEAATAVQTAISTGSAESGLSAAGVAAATPVAEAGTLASTAVGTGLSTLPAVTASGAIDTALAGGAAGAAGAAGEGLSQSAIDALPGATAAPNVADLAGLPNAVPNVGAVGNTLSDIGGGSGLGDLLNKIGKGAGPVGALLSGIASSQGDTALENARLALAAENANLGAELSSGTANANLGLQAGIANTNAGLSANSQNMQGRSLAEQMVMNRAQEEAAQRKTDLHDVKLDSYLSHPAVSPFDPTGGPQFSDNYKNTVAGLARQGSSNLSKGRRYNVADLPALTPYSDYSPINVQTPAPITFKPVPIPATVPSSQGGTQMGAGNKAINAGALTAAGLQILAKIFG